MAEKKQFKFYKSYWDSYKALPTDKEKIEFINILCETAFFEKHIDSINPKSNNVKLLFASIKHSINTSLQGYCDKLEIDYNSMFNTPLSTPLTTPLSTPFDTITTYNIQHTTYNKQQTINNKEEYTKEFEDWYLQYPRHTSKKEAFKIYSKVIKTILPSKLIDSAIKYKNHCLLNKTDVKFIKHPTTWLNQGCWDDEYGEQIKPQMSEKTKEFFDKYKTGE